MTEQLTVSLRFTHLVAYARISFHFEDDTIPLYVFVYPLTLHGHLCCFHFLAIVNSATMNVGLQTSL